MKTNRRIFTTACWGLLLLGALAPPALQAQDHRVTTISPEDSNNLAEVSIAINPANPDHILVAGMQLGTPGQAAVVTNYVYASYDGGRSWTTTAAHNPEGRLQADDVIAFGGQGRAYHAYISYVGIGRARPDVARNGVWVRVSDDAGRSWQAPAPIVDHINTVAPFEDKPWLVVDRARASPHQGAIYAGWSRFDVYNSPSPRDSTHIYFSRSTDQGATFTMPIRISNKGGTAEDGDEAVMGAMPAVGIDGTVYVVWNGPGGLTLDQSSDGGLTFGTDQFIRHTPGGWDLTVAGLWRTNGLPVIAVDHSEGSGRGSLYICWVDTTHGDHDVFVIRSQDQGATWSAPQRVNDDPQGNGKDQFLAWMAVDPADGSVNVLFYDRRASDDRRTTLTLARSIDGGRSFVNHPIAQPPFVPNEAFFGDYAGIDAYGGLVAAAYMHGGKDSKQDVSVAIFRFHPGTQEKK